VILETFPVNLVPTSDQKSWRRVFRERFQDLLSGPSRRRMFGHVEMHQPTSTMGQNHQTEQNPKGGGRDRKEIDGNQLVQMVVEERLPGLRGRLTFSGEESRHGSFRDGDTQLKQLPVDTRRSPKRVGSCYLQDQSSNRGTGFWTAALLPGNPAPVKAKALALPGHDGLWPYDNQRSAPILPTPGQPHPKEAIRCPCQKLDRRQRAVHSQGRQRGEVVTEQVQATDFMAAGAGGRSCPGGRSLCGPRSTEVGKHPSSVRERSFKPPAVRSGDAVRRPPAVQ
jgi:hypothetical protein